MKKYKKHILKIFKWSAIGIFAYWFLSTLILGHTELDTQTGIQRFAWSGLDALFSKQEFGFFRNKEYKTQLEGVDGPYIFGSLKYYVNEESNLVREEFNRIEPIHISVNNKDKDQFDINIKKYNSPVADTYDLPEKLIAISDIEGNFDALYSFLVNNEVIDKNYNWLYGNGHLVLNGDFFDRGIQVNQVLWLIYGLEEKAEKQGGKVHFINGNHEIMNLYGDVSNADHRYIEVAKQISTSKHWSDASKFLYSKKSELGAWLRTKNVIEKVGPYIFVHGGLNKDHISEKFGLSEINKIARNYYGKRFKRGNENDREHLIVGTNKSPYWDRSLAMNLVYKTVFFLNGASPDETSESELEEILNFYGAQKIVIGHSVVNKVSLDYNGKVIKIDVKHGSGKNNPNTQGLLIENGVEYSVNGLGKRARLKL